MPGPTRKWNWFEKLSGVKILTPAKISCEYTSQQITSFHVPSDEVISRTGYRCIVKATKQWYIKYGEPSWKARVKAFIKDKLETYNPTVKQ